MDFLLVWLMAVAIAVRFFPSSLTKQIMKFMCIACICSKLPRMFCYKRINTSLSNCSCLFYCTLISLLFWLIMATKLILGDKQCMGVLAQG
jgi:hypothetical protein